MTLVQSIRRRISGEFAARFLTRPSRQAVTGRYISICFDDFPKSAAETGAKILEAAHARGTYYLSASLSNMDSPVGPIADIEMVRRLSDNGHEIGCHTFYHQDCSTLTPAELAASLTANQQAVDFCRFESFAFPFGYWDWGSKSVALKRYVSARTGARGLNQGHVDLAGLKSVPLYERWGAEGVDRWLQHLANSDGWLIFYTHDVVAEPSNFGCTPELLTYCLERAALLGCQVETVGRVAKRFD